VYTTSQQVMEKLNLVLLEQSQNYQFLKGHNLVNSCPIFKKFSFL